MRSNRGDSRPTARPRVRGLRLQHLLFVPVIIASALLGVGPGQLQHAQAQPQNEESGAVRHIVVTVNKSRTLRFDNAFASAVVGAPDIVDALPMSDRVLYIQGKKVGTTNVSVYDQDMKLIGVIDVEVTLDTGNLQEKIRSSTTAVVAALAAATARSCSVASPAMRWPPSAPFRWPRAW